MLIGRITRDPELNFAAGKGTAICKFNLAVSRPFKKDETDFINCTAFGKIGETIAQYLIKGSPIAIVGNIRTGSYEAKDGTKRYTTDVIVESFDFIGGNASKRSENTGGFEDGMTEVFDDEMPF